MSAFRFLPPDDEMPDVVATANYANAIQFPPAGVQLTTMPPAWAKHRNDLAECLEAFSCLRGNVFISNGVVLGCLVDADCGERSYLDSEIIITKIGGSTEAPGGPQYRPQRVDLELKLNAWERTKKLGTSVVVIAARSYPKLPFVVPDDYRYMVLENFRVSLMWAELDSQQNIIYMVKMEKCNLLARSWWTPSQPDPPAVRDHRITQCSLNPLPITVCESCGEFSPIIYNEVTWICLNKSCDFFFTSNNAHRTSPPQQLTFHPQFLVKRTFHQIQPDHFQPAYSLAPDLVGSLRAIENTGQVVARLSMLWKGVICPQCHCLIPKIYWHMWSCTECDGGFNVHFSPGPISLRSLVPRTLVSYVGHPPIEASWPVESVDHQGPIFKKTYRVDKWILHGGCRLILLSPTASFNERDHGPSPIFDQMLQDANAGKLDLHRTQLSDVAENLSPYFEANYGEGYGFDNHHLPIRFNAAEDCVRRSAALLVNVGREELGAQYSEPNTIQVVGYLDGMGMPWHTDGGDELGMTISTLSLGGDATFRIRMQEYYYSNSNMFGPTGEVIRGAKNWKQARELKRLVDSGADVDPAQFFQQVPGNMYDDDYRGIGEGARPEIVLPLMHGSVLIMQGSGVQKYYEHCVEPKGSLRFAVTGRHVDQAQRAKTAELAALRRTTGQRFIADQIFEDEPDEEESPVLSVASAVVPQDGGTSTRNYRQRSPIGTHRASGGRRRSSRRAAAVGKAKPTRKGKVMATDGNEDDGDHDMDADGDSDVEVVSQRERSASPIASRMPRLGTNPTDITLRRLALEASRLPFTTREVNRMVRLRSQGLSWEAMAVQMGSNRTVESLRQRMVVERNRPANAVQDNDDAADDGDSGLLGTPDAGTPVIGTPAPTTRGTRTSRTGSAPLLPGQPGRTGVPRLSTRSNPYWRDDEVAVLIQARQVDGLSFADAAARVNAIPRNLREGIVRTSDSCCSSFKRYSRAAKKEGADDAKNNTATDNGSQAKDPGLKDMGESYNTVGKRRRKDDDDEDDDILQGGMSTSGISASVNALQIRDASAGPSQRTTRSGRKR